MDRIAGDVRGNADEKNAQDSSIRQQEASLQRAYEVLCEWRDVTAPSLNPRLSAVGFDDVPANGLLVLAAMIYGTKGRVLIRRLGIPEQESVQLLELLIQRGYLEFRSKLGDPRKATVVRTRRGLAAVEQVEVAAIARRWAEFPFRSGDIVISTALKSGTTWMQMICALLIFQTPSLPAPLKKLSPWMDERRGRAETYAKLVDQRHRRFIKTHVPLNEIYDDPRVTYVVVARNPLDAAVSWYYQIAASPTGDKPGGNDERPLDSPRQWVLDRIDEMGTGTYPHSEGIETQLKNLSRAWERRAERNVVLVHYEDLSADLAGEMRQLARRLDITVPEDKWPTLVQAATFKEMQAAAENLQPWNPDVGKGDSPFFRRGSSGEGWSLLTNAEIARYHARAALVAPRDLLTWLHRGNEELCARACMAHRIAVSNITSRVILA